MADFGDNLKTMIERQLAHNLSTYDIDITIEDYKLKDILTREQMQKIYSCLNEIAENAEKKIKKDSGSLLKINGQSFRCNCGCNVFHQYEGYDDIFICNSCKIEYETK